MSCRSIRMVLIAIAALISAMVPATVRGAEARMVHFTVDLTQPRRAISPYVYGVNSGNGGARPINRLGGNRWTAYNWETNASNAGSDWHHQNDNFLCKSTTPGEAVKPAILAAARDHQALILTVPICGYVSADEKADGDVNQTPDYLHARFFESRPKKPGALSLTPDVSDRFVYQDEFVNWVEHAARVDAKQIIFYALDNEPDIWAATHARIHADKVTYAEMIQRTIDFAGAIKDVKPDALVFGPVSYGFNGFRSLQDAPDANGREFLRFYLQEMKAAEAARHRRLVDVLDVHWYPEARGGADGSGARITDENNDPATVAARVQAPRSLWDATYTEHSWITDKVLHKPIALLPWLRTMIDESYPGTKLAITEYNYGGTDHISGAVAQADVLGILGREGVFAANFWDLTGRIAYVNAAFDVYLNYDGNGGHFGSQSVEARSDDIAAAPIYAGADEAKTDVVTVVMINRSDSELVGEVKLIGTANLRTADVYQLTSAGPEIKPVGSRKLDSPNSLRQPLPAMSVTIVRLSDRAIPGR